MKNISFPKPIKLIDKKENSAVIEINDCYPGYGITLANALRRAMLSSLPGAAITSVKIKNAPHEFSTIEGVKEDLVEIILNLKQLRFKFYGNEPVKARLLVKGEKEATAGNIETNSRAEVINKDAHIATLTRKNAELDMELTIEKGLGYAPVEQRDRNKKEIGVITIDAIFSPIRKVGYEIENVRVGQRTDYNKIIFEIETDGSIEPEEALRRAAQILIEQFAAVKSSEKEKETATEKPAPPEAKEKKAAAIPSESFLGKSIDELKFSNRIRAILEENKLKTVGAIVKKTENELLSLPKMGKASLKEVRKELGKLGMTLKQ
ncbi:DNA-directed RNA polymerase subunit alpha [Patescibacteria group bacterium]|nr:DNA-directed RNA polymerase subunit alpha [Patescibacteria group bacterium]MBU4056331.1 DNA-directed RNA polymerase subunit alpha [Patescibacteria group bacterium]MBU4368975.1 DNA-directed RNA polymerase subunit alpha [Patescibacteria group bacterium]